MSKPSSEKRYVHLVGSIPLENSTAVFQAVSSILSGCIHRIPDGETGNRSNWIGWQFPLLASTAYFEAAPPISMGNYEAMTQLKLRADIKPEDIQLPPLGYSQAAVESYKAFLELKNAGTIAKDVRFQVSLPTPLAPVHSFLHRDSITTMVPLYEEKMLAELDEILAAIPSDDLAIQWDTAVEFALLEATMPTPYEDVTSMILDMLVRIGNRVPAPVELGYHLCYGDAGHAHFIEPQDTSKLVMVANAIAERVNRPLNWIHLPVPRNRTDNAYFEPLSHLNLQPETELYLGLVHATDGVEGAQQRINTAKQFVESFGIATECGLGRRDPQSIPDLLTVHAEVANKSS